jgi:hypothetical protein
MAIADRPVIKVAAIGGVVAEAVLADDLVVMLAFDDGSAAAITYATGGHPRTLKERVEILGRRHTIVIDDYRAIEIDGRRSKHVQDKGHVQQLVRFAEAQRRGDGFNDGDASLLSMRACLRAADSLRSMSGMQPEHGIERC